MRRPLSALLPALLLLAACSAAPPAAEPATATLFAMDTVMELTAYGDGAADALAQAQTRLLALDRLLSVTDEDSEIYAANHSDGQPVALSEDTAQLLTQALALCEATGGALDVTIYPVVRAWGFTTGQYQVPAAETLAALLPQVDYRAISLNDETVTVPAGAELDLGAVAKGYAGDQVLALLRQAGISSAIVSLGGNVQTLGSRPDGDPWRVAVQDPAGEGFAGVLEVTDRAVVTSGGYQRYFEADGVRYWHILDPSTGYPADNGLLSVTVVAPQGVEADALSTALFVLGPEKAAAYWRANQTFDYLLLHADGALTLTQGLEGSFTPAGTWAEGALEVVRP